ncbi:MAG TPA: MBL fold metallo-hydrolase [Firmicutes bacterium]|nr:MBL fold metallo-hydrolase [Bacillota bacterium]
MLHVNAIAVGDLATNCYVLTDTETRNAAVIDPGAPDDRLVTALKGYKLTDILLTHAHFDHIGGVGLLADIFTPQIWIHELEAAWLNDPERNLSAWVSPLAHVTAPPATVIIKEHRTYTLLGRDLYVKHTPGHTPGHLVYYIEDKAFVGDLIFCGSVGRTDFPDGDHQTLLRSIKAEILSLPKQTPLYPGHGPATTVDTEKTHNPFMQQMDTL